MPGVISPLGKPPLTERIFALARIYADRDGEEWYVYRRAWFSQGERFIGKLEMCRGHPGQGDYDLLRGFFPTRETP